MGANRTPRLTISLAKCDSQEVLRQWREIAAKVGFTRGDGTGDISALFVAIGSFSASDTALLAGFLKKILDALDND